MSLYEFQLKAFWVLTCDRQHKTCADWVFMFLFLCIWQLFSIIERGSILSYLQWFSGIAARMYFRYMDQSDPNIQKKMMQAFTELLSNDYVSDLSPTKHWLAAFTEYAEAQAPANLNSDGFVRQDVFYDLLGDFLDEQVCLIASYPFEVLLHAFILTRILCRDTVCSAECDIQHQR